MWDGERRALGESGERSLSEVDVYGYLMTLILAVGGGILVRVGGAHAVAQTALAAIAATVICFLGDAGQAIVRAAARDPGTRMYAWATRRFLLVITATVVFCTLLGLGLAGETVKVALAQSTMGWLVVGAGMALLGDRALSTVNDRVANALGLPRPEEAVKSDLELIEGLSQAAAARLAEEGIDSVHTLALSSTRRIFFSTPYTLAEVCDWQDQALLIVHVGAEKAASCRQQLLLRGAGDLKRLAEKQDAASRARAQQILGLSDAAQVDVVLARVAADPAVSDVESLQRKAEARPASPAPQLLVDRIGREYEALRRVLGMDKGPAGKVA